MIIFELGKLCLEFNSAERHPYILPLTIHRPRHGYLGIQRFVPFDVKGSVINSKSALQILPEPQSAHMYR